MEHTPGPWTVSTGSVYVDNGKEWPTTPIAHMDRDTPFTRPVERDANARLIAAAPALLEALEKALKMMDSMTTRDWERGADHPIREQVRDAIRKAKS